MNKLEIACVIVGCIGILFNEGHTAEGKVAIITNVILTIISDIIFALMILLPLYFNYWR